MNLATTPADFRNDAQTPAELVRCFEGTGFRFLDLNIYKAAQPGSYLLDDRWERSIAEAGEAVAARDIRFCQAHAPRGDLHASGDTFDYGDVDSHVAPNQRPISNIPDRSGRDAMTLLELLAVIAVVGLLAALLLPALGAARERSRQARCAGHLRSIGQALHAYANDHADRLPVAARLNDDVVMDWPRLGTVLSGYLSGNEAVFACPSDLAAGTSYYREQGTSYEWNTFLNGRLIDRTTLTLMNWSVSPPLLWDAEPVHGNAGRNVLQPDGSVAAGWEVVTP